MPCTWATVSIEDQDQTFFQIPVALRINDADMNAGGWKLAPSFKIAYVPTFGDTKSMCTTNIEADVIGMSGSGAGAGTENLLLNATFSLGAGREGSSSVGGKIDLRAIHRLRMVLTQFMGSRKNAKDVPWPKSPVSKDS